MDDLKETLRETMEHAKGRVEDTVEDVKQRVSEIRSKDKKQSPSLGIIRLDYADGTI